MLLVTDSPFYRVTAKALIFDEESRLLLLKNSKDNWELPGGGWEHDESFEACIKRETQEELGVGVKSVGPIVCTYRGTNFRHGFKTLRLASRVELASHDFVLGDGMLDYRFVTEQEFSDLDLMRAEGDVQSYAGLIWSGS